MVEDAGRAPHDVFGAPWLRLREPVDHRSRHEPFAARIEAEGVARGWSRVVDLGGGTGSNVRYLAHRLTWPKAWWVVDHDPALLASVEPPAGASLRTVRGDLAREGLEAVEEVELVTASALLDLVSDRWIDALADRCATHGSAALFALSYDGKVSLRGKDEDLDDDFVLDAVNRHQVGEKGMGSALGPGAAAAAQQAFERVGYVCRSAPSPWVLTGQEDAALAEALMTGWVRAAVEIHPREADRLQGWLRRRVRAFRRGSLRVTVGHRDVLALPGGAHP